MEFYRILIDNSGTFAAFLFLVTVKPVSISICTKGKFDLSILGILNISIYIFQRKREKTVNFPSIK